jgi:hypothetical protein
MKLYCLGHLACLVFSSSCKLITECIIINLWVLFILPCRLKHSMECLHQNFIQNLFVVVGSPPSVINVGVCGNGIPYLVLTHVDFVIRLFNLAGGIVPKPEKLKCLLHYFRRVCTRGKYSLNICSGLLV